MKQYQWQKTRDYERYVFLVAHFLVGTVASYAVGFQSRIIKVELRAKYFTLDSAWKPQKHWYDGKIYLE